ncbi:MAG: formimidoylglutamate deiminase [Devosia sp.]|uniref:formimidoylglutamate deiminase n=1 Tax=Devosia sp. TaxID=1871048 RepID=UPI001AD0911D|nr:formimidoylglutamate deiminase [Devosia sp.]MBN9310625.1 formimidoylglutamate deiminase [Devosia sp.]
MRQRFQMGLLGNGWAHDIELGVEADRFASMEGAPAPVAGPSRAIVPGLVNLHSHAFQRGMAGLAERRGSNQDSFWSWRDVMYRFLDRITPDDCRAIAAMAFAEMLESGFTRVVEFHYLHHDIDGSPYADLGEMAGQIAAAAADTGISLTLLPVLYSFGNFGCAPPNPGQRRFLNDLDRFARLVEASRPHLAALTSARLGVAPHSLRAVDPRALAPLTALVADGPIHMHIAEQPREVADCLAWSKARPVEWLLDNASVDDRWCLIHATHITEAETTRLAATGAVAGLCPVTEANLGDGIFPALDWLAAGGSYGVGTDSNVSIGLAAELRLLEYSQRLKTGGRNILADRYESTGRALFERASVGGSQAAGTQPHGLAVGGPADFVVLDLTSPALVHRTDDAVLDSWIFGNDRSAISSVTVAGREVVSEGLHVKRDAISRAFARTMERLTASL